MVVQEGGAYRSIRQQTSVEALRATWSEVNRSLTVTNTVEARLTWTTQIPLLRSLSKAQTTSCHFVDKEPRQSDHFVKAKNHQFIY